MLRLLIISIIFLASYITLTALLRALDEDYLNLLGLRLVGRLARAAISYMRLIDEHLNRSRKA